MRIFELSQKHSEGGNLFWNRLRFGVAVRSVGATNRRGVGLKSRYEKHFVNKLSDADAVADGNSAFGSTKHLTVGLY